MKKIYIGIILFALIGIGAVVYYVNIKGGVGLSETINRNRSPADTNTSTGIIPSNLGVSSTTMNTANWMTYRSEKFMYEVKYPKTAEIKSKLYEGDVHFLNAIVAFKETVGINLEKYFEVPIALTDELNRSVGGLPLSVGISAIPEKNSDNISVRSWLWGNGFGQGQAPEPDLEKDMTFAGEPAYYIEHTYHRNNDGLYLATDYSIFLFHKGNLYEIGGIKLPVNPTEQWKFHPYYKYLEQSVPITEAIIKSFRFTDTK